MSTQSENLDSVLNGIRSMLALNNQVNVEARKRGEDYNIFEILGEKYSELAHSAFIADIINPKGSHALGSAPLQFFLNNIGVIKWSERDIDNADVSIEVSANGETDDEWGRMDIVIKSNDKVIIIENKIYAGDQPKQLRRYKTYAEQHFPQNHTLLYLTLDGHVASDLSTDGLEEGKDYFAISYKKDIMNLVDECIKFAVRKPLVREVLNQYMKTVESLVGVNSDDNETKAIFDYVIQNREIISQVFTDDRYSDERKLIINNHTDDFFHYSLQHLVSELKEYARNKGLICSEGSLFSGGRYCGFSFSKKEWNKTITFQFTQPYWKGCYYGIHSEQETNPGKKMKHLKEKPNNHYCYGNSYTDYKNWDIKGLITGEIKMSIINALDRTISVMASEPDTFSMV